MGLIENSLIAVSLTFSCLSSFSALAADDSSVVREIAQAPSPTPNKKKKKKNLKAAPVVKKTKISFEDQSSLKPKTKSQIKAQAKAQAAKVSVSPHLAPPAPPAQPVYHSRPMVVATPSPTPLPAPSDKFEGPKFGPFQLTAYFKSIMDLGTAQELQTIGGQNYWWQNSIMLGLIHESGWGLKGTAAVVENNYDDPSKNTKSSSDVSGILTHPNLYKEDGVSINGYFRVFFPTSDSSKKTSKYEYRYVSIQGFDGPVKELSFENDMFFHYFSQTTYSDTSPDYYFEDEFDTNYAVASWLSFGFAPYFQLEHHETGVNGNGTRVDLIPIVDITYSNFLIEARYYAPVWINGVVGGSAVSASVDQGYGEFVFKASF